MRMIIGGSLTPLKSSSTMRGVGPRDDNSRTKVHNVRGDSSAASQVVGDTEIPYQADTPVAVQIVFWLPAPRSIPKTKRSAPIGQRCDLDKLERGILDALTSVVSSDDGQVLYSRTWKAYAPPGTMPWVDINVQEVSLDAWPWNRSVLVPQVGLPPTWETPSAFVEGFDAPTNQ